MTSAGLTSADSERARQIWAEFSAIHDLSDRHGQAAGIDPKTARIWFGNDALDIVDQMDAADEFRPLYFIRVGQDHYVRKGGLR